MEKTAEKLKVNESLLKTVLCSATFWGLLAHGMVLFNKYSFHDDVRYFNEVGATYESGRWMLGILGSLSANLLGSKNYSLPVVNGTITILCIAAIVYLLADSLRIQSKPLVILLCGSMVTFPSVTGTFSYMFTAPYYYAASLLGVVGAWIFHQKKNVVALLLCTVLMACSVGVYQANIPVCICTLLLYMMEDIRQSDMNWKAFWKMALCNATVCIGFVTEYFLVNQYFLNQFGVVLTDYKGIKQLYFRYKELINYVIVGGLTTVVSLASYYFFTTAFLDPQDPFQLMAANTFSWICAVSFAYITNRKFVFESKSADKLREMLKFFSARISTLLIEMACMTLLVNILHWNDRISKFAVQFIVMALNYIFSKLFVFRIKE